MRLGVYVCHCGRNIADTVDVAGEGNFSIGLTTIYLPEGSQLSIFKIKVYAVGR